MKASEIFWKTFSKKLTCFEASRVPAGGEGWISRIYIRDYSNGTTVVEVKKTPINFLSEFKILKYYSELEKVLESSVHNISLQ